MSEKRSEPQRVARRIRTLQGRVDRLGRLMADAKRWAETSPGAQNHIVAEHSALSWAVDFINRHRGLAFTEARAIQEVKDQQEASDAATERR